MIDRQVLSNFRKDFAEAVKGLEQKYGLVIDLGQISFTPTSFTTKITCREGEDRFDVNAQEFKKYCKAYGLSEEDYDCRFTFQGKDYVIVGIRPSKRKYPICCKELSSSNTYSFTAEGVRKALGK